MHDIDIINMLTRTFMQIRDSSTIIFDYGDKPSNTVLSFRAHNRTGLNIHTISVKTPTGYISPMNGPCPYNHRTEVFAIDSDTESISDQYIHNLNTASPYRYSYDIANKFHRCIFIKKEYFGKDPRYMETIAQKGFINNILSCAINLVAGEFLGMDTNHINIFSVVVTAIVARKIGIALTPEFFADTVSTTPAIAERILEIASDDNISGLPWYI